MAIPKDKDELQKAIIDNYKKLKTELLSIPTDLTTIKELEGHSKNTLTRIFWFNLRKVQFFGNRVHLQKQQSVFYLKSYSQSTPLLN
jgi:hypothetical protein